MKFLRSARGKLFLSVALGLGLAWFFYKACAGGKCLVIGKRAPAPEQVHMDTDGQCYRFDRYNTYCQFPHREGHTDWIMGAGYQDPGYYNDPIQQGGHGSIGATYEGFGFDSWRPENGEPEGFTADCLGLAPAGTEYASAPFYQVACRDEPRWNLPRDARVFHQAKYPCGVPGQCGPAGCQKRHPMDSIYAPPNEGIMTRQVRN